MKKKTWKKERIKQKIVGTMRKSQFRLGSDHQQTIFCCLITLQRNENKIISNLI